MTERDRSITFNDVSDLRGILEQNQDRGRFYTELARIYKNVGASSEAVDQIISQAQITTGSGPWGGAAMLGNLYAQEHSGEGYNVTLDQFSYEIADRLLTAIEADLIRQDRTGTGILNADEIQALDYSVWHEKAIGAYFPGNAQRVEWSDVSDDSIVIKGGFLTKENLERSAEWAPHLANIGELVAHHADSAGRSLQDYGFEPGIIPVSGRSPDGKYSLSWDDNLGLYYVESIETNRRVGVFDPDASFAVERFLVDYVTTPQNPALTPYEQQMMAAENFSQTFHYTSASGEVASYDINRGQPLDPEIRDMFFNRLGFLQASDDVQPTGVEKGYTGMPVLTSDQHSALDVPLDGAVENYPASLNGMPISDQGVGDVVGAHVDNQASGNVLEANGQLGAAQIDANAEPVDAAGVFSGHDAQDVLIGNSNQDGLEATGLVNDQIGHIQPPNTHDVVTSSPELQDAGITDSNIADSEYDATAAGITTAYTDGTLPAGQNGQDGIDANSEAIDSLALEPESIPAIAGNTALPSGPLEDFADSTVIAEPEALTPYASGLDGTTDLYAPALDLTASAGGTSLYEAADPTANFNYDAAYEASDPTASAGYETEGSGYAQGADDSGINSGGAEEAYMATDSGLTNNGVTDETPEISGNGSWVDYVSNRDNSNSPDVPNI